jgi:LysR family transcriptional regulator of gallate degradation
MLEGMLGQALFLRTAHGMVPTDAGRRWTERFGARWPSCATFRKTSPRWPGGAGRGDHRGLPLARSQLLPAIVGTGAPSATADPLAGKPL